MSGRRHGKDPTKRLSSASWQMISLSQAHAPRARRPRKAQYIDASLRLIKGKGYSFKKIMVRIYGAMAVVNALFNQKATFDGQDWSGDFLITDVWVKRDSGWQVVARHASRPVTP